MFVVAHEYRRDPSLWNPSTRNRRARPLLAFAVLVLALAVPTLRVQHVPHVPVEPGLLPLGLVPNELRLTISVLLVTGVLPWQRQVQWPLSANASSTWPLLSLQYFLHNEEPQ